MGFYSVVPDVPQMFNKTWYVLESDTVLFSSLVFVCFILKFTAWGFKSSATIFQRENFKHS